MEGRRRQTDRPGTGGGRKEGTKLCLTVVAPACLPARRRMTICARCFNAVLLSAVSLLSLCDGRCFPIRLRLQKVLLLAVLTKIRRTRRLGRSGGRLDGRRLADGRRRAAGPASQYAGSLLKRVLRRRASTEINPGREACREAAEEESRAPRDECKNS